MADVITFAGTGVTYKNGTATVYAPIIATTGVSAKINARVEHNSIASQSGTLDYRFDENSYSTTSVAVTSSSSGVVSAVAGRRIEVMGYTLIANTNLAAQFYSGSNTISGSMSVGANGGASVSPGTQPVMTTNVGEALNVTIPSGTLNGHLSYRIN